METRIRVAALIIDNERVLLVSTKKGRAGYLVPPGGGHEPPEALSEAVVREAAEEAGLCIECGELVGYRELLRPGRFEVELYFRARLLQNPDSFACVSQEERSVQWVELAALPRTPHFPERLRELCAHIRDGASGALDLGRSVLAQNKEAQGS